MQTSADINRVNQIRQEKESRLEDNSDQIVLKRKA